MKNRSSAPAILFVALAVLASGSAVAASPAAYWEGTISVPGTQLKIAVALDAGADETWSGTIDVPAQAIRGYALSQVKVEGRAVSFAMLGIPGDPVFEGEISEDGKTISGDFTQAEQTVPFELARADAAERKKQLAEIENFGRPGSPGEGLVGSWRGMLEAGPTKLRLLLKVRTDGDGAMTASVDSLDQGSTDVAVEAITLEGRDVRFEMPQIEGTYTGVMSEDGSEIVGSWKQRGNSLPLTYRRD